MLRRRGRGTRGNGRCENTHAAWDHCWAQNQRPFLRPKTRHARLGDRFCATLFLHSKRSPSWDRPIACLSTRTPTFLATLRPRKSDVEKGPPQCQKTFRKVRPRTSQNQFLSPSQVKVHVLGSGCFSINIFISTGPIPGRAVWPRASSQIGPGDVLGGPVRVAKRQFSYTVARLLQKKPSNSMVALANYHK